jgi:surface antigen
MNKGARRKLVRYGLISGNIVLLLIVALFIAANRSASSTVRSSTLNSAVATASSNTNPLDTLSSAQIALTAAQLGHLSELTQIRNQADSDSLALALPPSDSSVLAKPQIVSTALKSKQDIIHYVSVSGDTVASLSTKFNVTADSIRWSNSVTGNALTPGTKLVIPPVNGIVYTVKNGDTPASIANKYSADEGQIIALNDAEISGLQPGELIIVPNGKVAAVTYYGGYSTSYNIGSYTAVYGGNGYAPGWCTWYVASRIAVPNNWGNANTWDDYARLSGWTVSSRPVVGAIAQTDSGWGGHVGIVEAVSADGSQIQYSDMNGLRGFGQVGYSGWVSAGTFPHYIYH